MSVTTKNIGKVSVTPRGAWVANSTYEYLDIVSSDGASYLAKQNVPAGISVSSASYWVVLTSRGPAPTDQQVQNAVNNWFDAHSSDSSHQAALALAALINAANNGKVIAVQSGALVAVDVATL